MENHQWHDPLLITDASWHQNPNPNSHSHNPLHPLASFQDSLMADPDINKIDGECDLHHGAVISLENRRSEAMSTEFYNDPIVNNVPHGSSIFGFPLTSPDLVICGDSPDILKGGIENSSGDLKGISVQLSLEDGIDGSEITYGDETRAAADDDFTMWGKTSNEDVYAEASFELPVMSSIKNDYSVSKEDICYREDESPTGMGMPNVPQCESPKENVNGIVDGDFGGLQAEYENQSKELNETKRALEVLRRENEQKIKECQEAWNSLKELQNELMRKSMHVGSLAFAVEGQVKEKSRWFSSLSDLTRKLKLLKLEQIKLSEEALLYKKYMEDMNQTSSMIQLKLTHQVELHEDLKMKFIKGAKERKELYNKMLELKGNIRVFCRCRPLNAEEIANGTSMSIDFDAAKDGELTVKSNGTSKRIFKFDAVFSPRANQVDVFEDTAPVATSVLDGYNVCIFAYGQTGSGKTFTMEGTDEARGVNFRTLQELFRIIDERKNQIRYEICVSVLEVYNEQIRDLLLSESHPTTKRLEIRQVGEGTHHVPGLVEAHVNNMSEVWDVLQTGSNARAVGSTNANEHSSRSHCIHCVMVKGENLLNGETTKSKLWLVDLAGSERIAKTEVQGERLRETQNINRSLSALGDVISALATKSPHIPFRNSKLTHLLQDSLGGDSKTLMFVQVSPNENDMSETLCSLNFATRVRGIELGPAKKQLESSEVLKYKQMVEKIKQEMKSKDVQIKRMEDSLHGLDMKMKEKDLKNKNLQEKIKELESQLLIERKLARQHVDTKIAEHQQQQMRQRDQEDQIPSVTRPPLVAKPSGGGILNNFNEVKEVKEQVKVNPIRPLTDNNNNTITTPTDISYTRHHDPTEKENSRPETTDQQQQHVPKLIGRASLCPLAQRIPPTNPRRNSLIPLPKFQQPFLPLVPPIKVDERVDEVCGPEWGDSPKECKTTEGGKKLYSRKSFHKKTQMKSPMHMRRGGVNVGVRVSIGSRGRLIGGGGGGGGHRGLMGNARRGVLKEVAQKPVASQREKKEKGWNSTTSRNI